MKYVEITSGSEFEMDTHKTEQQRFTRINFHEVPVEESEGSSKEFEVEGTTGSSKEIFEEEAILDKSVESSSKEIDRTQKDTSIQDGDIESKESSKEPFKSLEDIKESSSYITPVQEESEEELGSTLHVPESLDSH
jgi:vacuolar-type H+-ATPase subunit I/STV1